MDVHELGRECVCIALLMHKHIYIYSHASILHTRPPCQCRYYIEMVAQPGQSRDAAQAEVDAVARAIIAEMLQPDENGLERPPDDWMAQ